MLPIIKPKSQQSGSLTDEQAIIKIYLKTGAGSSHGKSVQATIRFVIQPVILHSVYDSLDRLATASERTASVTTKLDQPQNI